MTVDREFLDLQTALRGRFSIAREIGRGGMGVVYLARDVQLERDVAIKLLAPALAAGADMRRRFLREARLAAQCFHPHIVPIHAVEESGSMAWFVMAYVQGETVAERVRRIGPLDTAELRRLAQEIGWALAYAHQRGVVHRDVKPENILMDAVSGRFLIADFGIARAESESASSHSDAAGTPRYMAPEQALGDAVDGRADLYALGATLFFAASGRPPFDAPSAVALVVQHASMPAPSVRAVVPSMDDALADAIDRCLAKQPDDRFLNAETFVGAIAPRLTEQSLPQALVPTRSHADAARSLLGLSAVIGATTWLLWLGEPSGSLARGIIGGIGSMVSVFLSGFGLLRAGEALQAARNAMRRGLSPSGVSQALAGETPGVPLSNQSRTRGMVLIGLGIAGALAQGRLPGMDGLPDVISSLMEPLLIFGPAYVIMRGTTMALSGTKVHHWFHKRVMQPLARQAANLLMRVGRMPQRALLPPSDAATELRLDAAVLEALHRLPPAQQQLVADAPRAAKALAREAERLRQQDAHLALEERVARGDTNPEGRTPNLERLQQERLQVQARLATTIAALETLRLDLLRLDSRDSSAASLTQQLEAVRELARRVDANVELNAYLANSNPTPAR